MNVGKHQGAQPPNLPTGRKWSAALGSGVKAGEARKQKLKLKSGAPSFISVGRQRVARFDCL